MRSSKYKGRLSAALTASCTCLIRSCKCRHCHHSEFAQLRAWLLVYCCLLKVFFCYCSHCSLPMAQRLLSLSPLPLCFLLCHGAANSSTVVVCCHHHHLLVDCCFFFKLCHCGCCTLLDAAAALHVTTFAAYCPQCFQCCLKSFQNCHSQLPPHRHRQPPPHRQ